MSTKTVNTRTRYKIIGSDFSAQEPRLTAFMSQDPAMIQAYNEGKDLYCVIAASMFGNKYEDNLEFYPEGTEIELDGKKVISGSGKEYEKEVENNSINIPYFYLVPTPDGDKEAQSLNIGDSIISDLGNLIVTKIEKNNELIKLFF